MSVAAGGIHALLGENGAGKSTLVKAIYGLVAPDAGTMRLDGAPYAPSTPRQARAAGVAMVFRHFSLFDALSVAENVGLGMDAPPPPRRLAHEIARVSSACGLPLDPGRRVGPLSAGARQRVEIVRCLLQDPRLLIMDEPTSVLTPQEVAILFATLRKRAAEGTAILYISHKRDEVRAPCDAATILRRGPVVARCDPLGRSAAELAATMTGAEVAGAARGRAGAAAAPTDAGRDAPALPEVRGLSLPPETPFATPLRDVGFALRAGEILGIGEITEAVPAQVRAEAEALRDAIAAGDDHPFTGPLNRQDGSVWLAEGEVADDGTLPGMNFYVEGLTGEIPR